MIDYYNRIADRYDQTRFQNSYGRVLDFQERSILKRYLKPALNQRILDIGCGTGRFVNFATDAIDPSENMLRIAQIKKPECCYYQMDAQYLNFEDNSFYAAFAIHLLMHLKIETIETIIQTVLAVDLPIQRELVIVDDYSTDGTRDYLATLKSIGNI